MKIIGNRTSKKTKLHVHTCKHCGQEFGSYRTASLTCSAACKNKHIGTRLQKGQERVCKTCGKVFWVRPSEDRRGSVRQYCSVRCTKKDPRIPIGRYVSYDGYWIITANGKRQQREHRVVYEKEYGPIPVGYIVHHKNGDRLDNRLENLEALSRTDHNNAHKFLTRESRQLRGALCETQIQGYGPSSSTP